MLRLSRIFKNYDETGSLGEQVNLYGFIGPQVFLTKTGEVGVILEVRGVDFECLDGASIDAHTKRLESALKLFDERGMEHGPITPLEGFGICVLPFRDPDNIQIELTSPLS